MISVCSGPFCPTKCYHDNISSNNNWEQNSNAVGGAEMMFPPYVSIYCGIEDEQQTTNNVSSAHVTMKRTFDSSERSLFEIGLETHWNASAEERRDVFQSCRRFKCRI